MRDSVFTVKELTDWIRVHGLEKDCVNAEKCREKIDFADGAVAKIEEFAAAAGKTEVGPAELYNAGLFLGWGKKCDGCGTWNPLPDDDAPGNMYVSGTEDVKEMTDWLLANGVDVCCVNHEECGHTVDFTAEVVDAIMKKADGRKRISFDDVEVAVDNTVHEKICDRCGASNDCPWEPVSDFLSGETETSEYEAKGGLVLLSTLSKWMADGQRFGQAASNILRFAGTPVASLSWITNNRLAARFLTGVKKAASAGKWADEVDISWKDEGSGVKTADIGGVTVKFEEKGDGVKTVTFANGTTFSWKTDVAFDNARAASGLKLLSTLALMTLPAGRFGRAIADMFGTAATPLKSMSWVENIDLEKKYLEGAERSNYYADILKVIPEILKEIGRTDE